MQQEAYVTKEATTGKAIVYSLNQKIPENIFW